MNKRVLCYGDSNTWGYDAASGGRFDDNTRWPRVLARQLGSGWDVVEAGLCGRTTVFEDPLNEGLCGLTHLVPAMGSASPLDAMVLMLGTNDCKERFSATAHNIADGLKRLAAKALAAPDWAGKPRLLLVAPIRINPLYKSSPVAGEMGRGCAEKSDELVPLAEACATALGCAYLDCNTVAKANTIDYMHLDAASHAALGMRIAEVL